MTRRSARMSKNSVGASPQCFRTRAESRRRKQRCNSSGTSVTLEARYRPYAKETALCVDFAYSAMEADILAELTSANGEAQASLRRLLQRLQARRGAISEFSQIVADAPAAGPDQSRQSGGMRNSSQKP
jgi:hypothetical protein